MTDNWSHEETDDPLVGIIVTISREPQNLLALVGREEDQKTEIGVPLD